MALVDQIIAYESGELSEKGMIELFAELIKTGQAWKLQGFYGRMASQLIEYGFISKEGQILKNIQ